MSITKIVEAMAQEASQAIAKEREVLQDIAMIATTEFAEKAAEVLDPTKHAYSFEVYLMLLQNLREILAAGVPEEYALDAVQTVQSAEMIIKIWKGEI